LLLGPSESSCTYSVQSGFSGPRASFCLRSRRSSAALRAIRRIAPAHGVDAAIGERVGAVIALGVGVALYPVPGDVVRAGELIELEP
jgi:hypothetical protein